MAKHRIDLDENALSAARAKLGTSTIKNTMNASPRRATQRRGRRISRAFDTLARAGLHDRTEAWR